MKKNIGIIFLLISFVCALSNAGLVGKWTFDDSNDVGYDSSTNGNDGSCEGDCVRSVDSISGAGCIELDGDGDYFQLFTCGGFNGDFSAGRLTFGMWIKLDDATPVASKSGLATLGNWSRPSRYPDANGDISLGLFLSNGSQETSVPLECVDLDQWHHFAVTVDSHNVSSGYKIYQNGQLVDALPLDGSLGVFLEPISPRIGLSYDVSSDTAYYLDGKIDDVVMYNDVLSQAEIMDIVDDVITSPDICTPYNNDIVECSGWTREMYSDSTGTQGDYLYERTDGQWYIGYTNASSINSDSTVGLVFQLPALGSGKAFSDAVLNFYYDGWRLRSGTGIDLYGSPYRTSTPVVSASDWYVGAWEGDAVFTAIQEDIITKDSSDPDMYTGWQCSSSAGREDLACYLNDQYADGAAEDDYVVLRMNLEARYHSNYYNLNKIRSVYATPDLYGPYLEYTIVDEAGTMLALPETREVHGCAGPVENTGGTWQAVTADSTCDPAENAYTVLVMAFRLPPMPAGYEFTDADMNWYYHYQKRTGGPIDAYGLGFRTGATPNITSNDFYIGYNDTSDATLIDTDVIDFAAGIGRWENLSTSGETNLVDYLNDQVAAGAKAGDWILIRFNVEYRYTTWYSAHTIRSCYYADSSYTPYIQYQMSPVQ
ncbi:MAG: LamG domain-containing protein [Sedimentisphaeraceae bacterium JB056]